MNALKHAQANHIHVSLSQTNGTVTLAIRDDGKGFDVSKLIDSRETHGMSIMQARTNRIGGGFIVESESDRGTEILVEVEIAKEQKRQAI